MRIVGLIIVVLGLQAQTPAPSGAPWQPRPVIIIDPRPYLSSPAPQPKQHATAHPKRTMPRAHDTAPPRRRPAPVPTPEVFERLDTSPRQ